MSTLSAITMKSETPKKVLLLVSSVVVVVLLDFGGSLLYGYFADDMRDQLFAFDPEVGLVHRPNVRFEVPWPEAVSGVVVYQTNNLGLREDRLTSERTDATHRVIVFGDSHTDGVVNNKDSSPHVAESLLRSHLSVEVLNAGIGLSCIKQHAKLLQRLLFLHPDIAVFTIFVGNDYADILNTGSAPSLYDRWLKHSIILRGLRRLDFSDRMRAERVNRYAMWQSIGQAYYFRQHPDSLQRASRLHEEVLASIVATCRKNNIQPLILILPTKYLVEYESARNDFEAIERLLQLSPDKKLDDIIRLDLRSILTRHRIPFIDLSPSFVSSGDSTAGRHLFWQADHHLSEHGHAVAGAVLADSLRSMLGRPRSSQNN